VILYRYRGGDEVKSNELKAELARNEMNYQKLADYLDVTLLTVQNKINGRSEFKPSEIVKVKELLNLTDERVFEIFLNGGN
jgi:hypothetical protein